MKPLMGPLSIPRMTDEWKYIIGGTCCGVKPNYSEKNLAQYQFVHHKSHVDCPRANPGLRSAVKTRRRALTHCRMAPTTVTANIQLNNDRYAISQRRKGFEFSASANYSMEQSKIPAFYGTRRFITAFTRARHHTSRSILILFSHIAYGFVII